MNEQYKNIARVKAINKKNEEKLLAVNPGLDDESGIYFLTRVDENGIKFSYVGQAVHIKQRMLSHMTGYQHIDLSLRKHGLYSADKNPRGWDINFLHFPKGQLDEKERYYITLYAKNGYQSRNKDTGGGAGKQELGERKPTKGYYDGILQGKKTLARELKHIIDTHLVITLKKPSKTSEKALLKFNDLLDENNYKSEREDK